MPATIEDVEAVIATLDGVTVGERWGNRTWLAGPTPKAFAWERPFSKADVKRFGTERVPEPPVVAVTVDDLAEKEAVLQEGRKGVFTIPHFDGYAAVLVELGRVDKRVLKRLLVDGWRAVGGA